MSEGLNESVLARFAVSPDIITHARRLKRAQTLFAHATKPRLHTLAIGHLMDAKSRLYRALKPANTFH